MSRMPRFKSGLLPPPPRPPCRLPPFGANRAVSSSRCTTASGTSRSRNSRTAPVVRSAGPSSTSKTVVAPDQLPTRSALQHLEDGIGGADGQAGAWLHIERGDHTVLDHHGVALR